MSETWRDILPKGGALWDSEYASESDLPFDAARDDTMIRLRPQLERKFDLYTIPDLDNLPRQEWLIEGALPAKALAGLIGPKGAFKTFVALDLSMHVALELPWHDRICTGAAVVYIYSEGAFGARDRVNAWLRYHERTLTQLDVARDGIPILFLPTRVAMNDARMVAHLEHDISTQLPEMWGSPGLIVVDTLNRNLDGDEDGKGMTAYVAGCARLQEAFGATVLSVHHTPIGSEDRGRGHSAFDGAIDTRFIISRDDDRVTLECTHQRNGPDDWTVAFEAIPMAGSLVLKQGTNVSGELRGDRRTLLEFVSEQGPASWTAIKTESGLTVKRFRTASTWLLARRYVKKDERKYTITDAGRMALTALGAHKVPDA